MSEINKREILEILTDEEEENVTGGARNGSYAGSLSIDVFRWLGAWTLNVSRYVGTVTGVDFSENSGGVTRVKFKGSRLILSGFSKNGRAKIIINGKKNNKMCHMVLYVSVR